MFTSASLPSSLTAANLSGNAVPPPPCRVRSRPIVAFATATATSTAEARSTCTDQPRPSSYLNPAKCSSFPFVNGQICSPVSSHATEIWSSPTHSLPPLPNALPSPSSTAKFVPEIISHSLCAWRLPLTLQNKRMNGIYNLLAETFD